MHRWSRQFVLALLAFPQAQGILASFGSALVTRRSERARQRERNIRFLAASAAAAHVCDMHIEEAGGGELETQQVRRRQHRLHLLFLLVYSRHFWAGWLGLPGQAWRRKRMMRNVSLLSRSRCAQCRHEDAGIRTQPASRGAVPCRPAHLTFPSP